MSAGGLCYHVLNRGNARATVFHEPGDFRAFLSAVGEAVDRLDPRIIGYCVMPNHFHLVLWPKGDGDMSRFMQRLLTAHVRRYHAVRGTSGHLWQGRYKAFPIQEDDHLLTVLRYVERNPLRARLVRRAENWPWSSLGGRGVDDGSPGFLRQGPCSLPSDWADVVNEGQTAAELRCIRASVNRGTPFGDEHWTKRAAARLGIEASLRPRGRPKKEDGSL
jgi:putative transposase